MSRALEKIIFMLCAILLTQSCKARKSAGGNDSDVKSTSLKFNSVLATFEKARPLTSEVARSKKGKVWKCDIVDHSDKMTREPYNYRFIENSDGISIETLAASTSKVIGTGNTYHPQGNFYFFVSSPYPGQLISERVDLDRGG